MGASDGKGGREGVLNADAFLARGLDPVGLKGALEEVRENVREEGR